MPNPLSPAEALAAILAGVAPLPPQVVALEDALGRTLAEPVDAPLGLPPFDNSAMDGYAVHAADLASASAGAPVHLRVTGTYAAEPATGPQPPLQPGTTARIMTGAPVPPGCTAVVMREDVVESERSACFCAPIAPERNLRRAGSDLLQGEAVFAPGTLVGAPEWALLAALGLAQVAVHRRPRVSVVVTGPELVEPGQPLGPGQVYNCNGFALRALLAECGCELAAYHVTGDDPHALEAILRSAVPGSDAVLTSGGVSAGDFDPVRDVLQAHAEVLFWKVAMRPGGPFMSARLDGVSVWALPGNPVSVMVCFETLVRPALLALAGRTATRRPSVEAVWEGASVRSTPGRTEYLRAQVRREGLLWRAQPCGAQNSSRLASLTQANALVEVPPETGTVEPGTRLQALLLRAGEPV